MKTLLSSILTLLLPQLLPGQFEAAIGEYLKEMNASHEVPGTAVAVLRGDEAIYESYFGMAELNHQVPVSKQTMFRVYSSTKLFHLNAREYPEAWNVWDSLGEGYEMAGDQEKVLQYYARSVEINPDNQHGVNKIKQLNK